MGSAALSARNSSWVAHAKVIGTAGEQTFAVKIATHLPDFYEVRTKFKKIEIYDDGRGIKPDCCIFNLKTRKHLFVENKTGNKGGNAHERAYRYLSPGLKQKIKLLYDTPTQPFFLVFAGKTFSGEPFYVARKDKKPYLVNPQHYQDEFSLFLAGENYAILDRENSNIDKVAKQIMEIV